jgi:hypothetical protein
MPLLSMSVITDVNWFDLFKCFLVGIKKTELVYTARDYVEDKQIFELFTTVSRLF